MKQPTIHGYKTDRSIIGARFRPLDMVFISTHRRIAIIAHRDLPNEWRVALQKPVLADLKPILWGNVL